MVIAREPSEALRRGRRALEALDGFILLRDWEWCDGARTWILHCQLAPGQRAHPQVPEVTAWYLHAADTYPEGRIQLFPAKHGGVTHTFAHQAHNAPGDRHTPWRTGALCLESSVQLLNRQLGVYGEPKDARQRLRWHIERAQAWLIAAASDMLQIAGDPFELPHYPQHSDVLVAFNEGPESLDTWSAMQLRAGMVKLERLRGTPPRCVVRSFCAPTWQQVHTPRWGTAFSGTCEREEIGIWILLDQVAVQTPWQAPTTWGELRASCSAQGIDLDTQLRSVLDHLRDGHPHMALIGFPVPASVGDIPLQIHWQAMTLPILSRGNHTMRGFRPNSIGYWKLDRTSILRADDPIQWIASQNWHAEQLSTRGRLAKTFTEQRIAILGVGAVGSVLATLLIHAGVRQMTLIDPDQIQAGNVVRHILGVAQAGQNKASALAEHLNAMTPHAEVTAIAAQFPNVSDGEREALQNCDIVIDCTAEDAILQALHLFPWQRETLFCSMALGGAHARRLYCFLANGRIFPHSDFEQQMIGWFARERDEFHEPDWPWEGVGCWHPVFPARIDHIWQLVAASVGVIEKTHAQGTLPQAHLTVLERREHATGASEVLVVHDPTAA